jgi:hypothetical protein
MTFQILSTEGSLVKPVGKRNVELKVLFLPNTYIGEQNSVANLSNCVWNFWMQFYYYLFFNSYDFAFCNDKTRNKSIEIREHELHYSKKEVI